MKKKNFLIGCLIATFLFFVAILVFGFYSIRFSQEVKQKRTIVTYNNQLVDERNKVVNRFESLTKAFNSAETKEEIVEEHKKYQTSIENYRNLIDDTEVPNETVDLQEANYEYADISEEISETAKQMINSIDGEGDTEKLIKQYGILSDKANEKNEEIGKILMNLTGIELANST